MTYLDPDRTYDVDAVSGSFMMLSREVLERVGGLDESFFMYGEDLDYCYRVLQAGYKVYYVHATQIIHFKGESTKRSEVDEIRVFYDAMRIFVRKHFSHSLLLTMFLSIGISIRAAAAFLGRASRAIAVALVDLLLALCAMLAGEFLRYGNLFTLPAYAYPVVWLVPPFVVVSAIALTGGYSTHRFSVARSGIGVLISYVLISATVFFAKEFAFSRFVVVIAGALSMAVIPGWRLIMRIAGRAGTTRRSGKILFGRRTVIVGTGPSAQAVLRKLRARVDDGYEVVGFVSTNRREVGERLSGLDIVGSIDNVAKVINDRNVTEVIFSTDGLSFTDILTVIGRSRSRGVNFRLVPNSLEAIIGKASIDELDAIPLVEIEYNIHKPIHRFSKRLFDIVLSLILLVTVYPFVALRSSLRPTASQESGERSWVHLLPQVVKGKLSFVGLPISPLSESRVANHSVALNGQVSYLGPQGLTGLVQIHRHEGLEPDEIEQFKLYYARNQSLTLDLEILMKSVVGGR
jgi:hypothetical protein